LYREKAMLWKSTGSCQALHKWYTETSISSLSESVLHLLALRDQVYCRISTIHPVLCCSLSDEERSYLEFLSSPGGKSMHRDRSIPMSVIRCVHPQNEHNKYVCHLTGHFAQTSCWDMGFQKRLLMCVLWFGGSEQIWERHDRF
jgi:hypothetical protein